MAFRSFQGRLLTFFLGLLLLMQVIVFLVVDAAVTADARAHVADELQVGADVFERLIRAQELTGFATLLSGDFGSGSV